MIPRAIWSSLKKEDCKGDDEDQLGRGKTSSKEEEVSMVKKVEESRSEKVMNLVSNKESSKNDVDKVSIIDKDVLGNDKSVEEWLKDKKEKSVKEWLEKSVDPGEGTKKKWVHSLEVNDNPERVAKSSDELIDDVFAAIKNGDKSKSINSLSEGEVIDVDTDSEEDKDKCKDKSDNEKRKKKKRHKEKERERDKFREKDREKDKKKKKKKKRSDDSDDQDEEDRRDKSRKKKKKKKSDDEEEFDEKRTDDSDDQEEEDRRDKNRKKKKKKKSDDSDNQDEKDKRDKNRKKKKSDDEEEFEEKAVKPCKLLPKEEPGPDVAENKSYNPTLAKFLQASNPKSYNANVSLPTEEEIKNKSDQLLDDLFTYIGAEKKKRDEKEMKRKCEEMSDDDEEESKKKSRTKKRSSSRGRKSSERPRKSCDRDWKSKERDRKSRERDKTSCEKDRKSCERDRKSKERDRSCDRDRKSRDRDRKSSERERKSREKDMKSSDKERKSRERDRKSCDRERKSRERDRKSSDREIKSKERDKKSSERERKSRERDWKSSDRDRIRKRSKSKSRRRSSSRGKKSSDKRTSRKRSRSRDGRKQREKTRSRSLHRGRSRSKSRRRSSSNKRSSSRSSRRRSRSQELIEAADKFERGKKGRLKMKQHLLDQAKLLKIAKEQVQGTQDTLRALSMQCMEIARKGLEEQARAEANPEPEEEESSSDEEKLQEVVLNVYATPSMMRISKSNLNYKNTINNELEKYGQLGVVTGFWMTPLGYDKAYERTIGDGMGGKKKAAYRPTGTSLLAIGMEGHADYQKVYLPTTIKIETKFPEKWENKGLIKTIFARASLYGDINIQDTNPHGKMHPKTAFPSASGTAPLSMQESSTALVVFNPNHEPKGPYNPFSKEAKEWEKQKRRQALLEALLPGGSSHPGSRRLEIEDHHVPFNPFSKEAKEAERLKKLEEKEAKKKEKEKKGKGKKGGPKEPPEAAEPEDAKKKGKPPQFNPFLEGFRPSSYGYGEVRWTDSGPLDVSRLGAKFNPSQTTKYKL